MLGPACVSVEFPVFPFYSYLRFELWVCPDFGDRPHLIWVNSFTDARGFLFIDRATILLHDPHADPSSPFCKSSEKLLFAARQILDLVYILCSTSFDVTLLDPVASFAWFLAARVLVRFLKAKIEARKHAEAVGLRNELEVIRLALKRVGERIPLGCECPIHFEIQRAVWEEAEHHDYSPASEDARRPLDKRSRQLFGRLWDAFLCGHDQRREHISRVRATLDLT